MRIDLHTHTTASDGVLTPEQLVLLAHDVGVGALGIADHDTTEGLDRAIAAGEEHGVTIIPAVEINTDVKAGEIHILGYFVHHHVAWFQRLMHRLREGRMHRAERMVEKLNALGVPLQFDRVLALSAGGAVGRPHVARALLEGGFVADTGEAFDRYIGRRGPAYVERLKVTPAQAIQVIRYAGGVPVLAHPGWIGDDTMTEELIHQGMEGIEVYYPDHTTSMIEGYLALARRHGLLVTGGTDFHGGDLATRVPLGSQYVPAEALERLRERAEGRRPSDEPPALDLESE